MHVELDTKLLSCGSPDTVGFKDNSDIFLAHLSRRLRGAYSIGRLRRSSSVRRPSVRRPSTIANDFSSETTGPIATKFHIQPPGPLGKKTCSNDLSHMTNMAAMPIYNKNLKNLLLQNQQTNDLKTYYVALCMVVLPKLFKL